MATQCSLRLITYWRSITAGVICTCEVQKKSSAIMIHTEQLIQWQEGSTKTERSCEESILLSDLLLFGFLQKTSINMHVVSICQNKMRLFEIMVQQLFMMDGYQIISFQKEIF